MDRRQAVGFLLVVVSAAAFGSGALFAKPVYAAGVDWHTLSAWRFGIGAVLSWAWVLVRARGIGSLRSWSRRRVVITLALGLLYVGNSGTYFAGLETVPASLAALIVYIYPAIVAVLALRFGRRLEGRRAWAALGLALAGVTLTVGAIDQRTAPPLAGLALIAASPVIYAVWIVLAARLSGERRVAAASEGARGADAAVVTALMTSATAVAYWASALAVGRPVLPAEIPAAAWPGLLGVGAVSTFVAIQAFYAGAQRVGAARAALVSTIEPVYTIGLAALLLGEVLGPVQMVGGALILAGVVLSQATPGAIGTRLRVRIADE
ncbi:MAG: DMT family transporter [Chloroflexota bacterium]